MSQLTCTLFTLDDELRAKLGQVGHVEVTDHIRTLDELCDVVRRRQPQLVIADLGEDPESVLAELERLAAPRPLLMVAGAADDSRTILRAMRLGAREFLSGELEVDALNEAVERLLLDAPTQTSSGSEAPVIAVMGAKGGVGATFVACQLAGELEHGGGHTVLTDVNLRLGDVALFCDLQPRYNLSDLATEQQDFDASYLQTILEPHPSGMRVLAAPKHAEDAEFVRSGHLERAVGFFRADFDWVVLDVSRTWDDISVRALDLSDQIVLVTTMDVPTLNHTRQHLDLLQRLGNSAEKIRVVVNRYARSAGLSKRDVSDFLGRSPEAWLPNDYPATLACVNEGKTIWEVAPRGPLTAGYRDLAREVHRWCGVEPPDSANRASRRNPLRELLRNAPWR